MKLDYIDKEFPTGLNENKNINSKDLAKLLRKSQEVSRKLSKDIDIFINVLLNTDGIVVGNIDEIIKIEKDVIDLYNKFKKDINVKIKE